MGLFDEIHFDCPKCGNEILVQSKAGKCTMATYDHFAVPGDIADDIAEKTTYCYDCLKHYVIKRGCPPATVTMYLYSTGE